MYFGSGQGQSKCLSHSCYPPTRPWSFTKLVLFEKELVGDVSNKSVVWPAHPWQKLRAELSLPAN